MSVQLQAYLFNWIKRILDTILTGVIKTTRFKKNSKNLQHSRIIHSTKRARKSANTEQIELLLDITKLDRFPRIIQSTRHPSRIHHFSPSLANHKREDAGVQSGHRYVLKAICRLTCQLVLVYIFNWSLNFRRPSAKAINCANKRNETTGQVRTPFAPLSHPSLKVSSYRDLVYRVNRVNRDFRIRELAARSRLQSIPNFCSHFLESIYNFDWISLEKIIAGHFFFFWKIFFK